ncbi:winged helix-turn-helix domain-containing protein [Streptomyces sp. H10-C2]|uniref:ArsR/SmtB family transcription factor n=1 Tax=unclassified Streptomyces TaxID=2593676 RepID=UPI0024B8CD7A|nr:MULTISPECIES: winged helix-turn-helix domain-containing protein [unclassified Streptomyces]MDJ0343621.1 winged helix-turn-helix domain-containing protein [Streptomyces sp. PH10-H1]MDJ0373131.1 winged helix-turn-helix domain-containing protein [Streptomyces sp. H10-C2]
MGWWLVNADTVAGSRFVVSPLAETIASLKTLERGTAAHPGERAWLDIHLPAYRKRQAGDPITALLIRAALGRTWNADFLTPPPLLAPKPTAAPAPTDGGSVSSRVTPPGPPVTFAQELARIRETPPESARADLTVSLNGPLPAQLHRSDLPERTADLLEWVWTESVLPSWPQRRRILEADVIARTAQLSQGGWAAALDDMHPGMRWLGESRLQINTHDYPPRELAGTQLLFVPVTSRQSWVAWDAPHLYAVVYPCSGALAEAGRASVPEALGTLLGPARAGVLVLLDTPKSTTQLVALTGQGLGSVGRHLKVLRDARLIQRRRTGRSVLYYRSPAGEVLVTAQENG